MAEEESEYPPLPDWVKPGVTYRYHFPTGRGNSPNPHHGKVFHIRGIVDNHAVIRQWFKHKQRWNYTVEPCWHFEVMEKHIRVQPAAKGKKK